MDAEAIREMFSAFGPVGVRRMFSGAGVFADGMMIAIVVDGVIYLKADAETVPSFAGEGLAPFTYAARGSRRALSYWRMPDRLYDDADELAVWARAALGAARRSAARKPGSRAKPAPTPRTKAPPRRRAAAKSRTSAAKSRTPRR